MIKDVKYILKRIIIGVGIALILLLIKGNLLTVVNASGNNSFSYNVDNIDDLKTYQNKVVSNFASTSTDIVPYFSSTVHRVNVDSLEPSSDYSISPTLITSSLTLGSSQYTNIYALLTQINLQYPQQKPFILHRGNHYSVLIDILKSQDLSFYMNPESIKLDNDSIDIYSVYVKNNQTITSTINDYIDIDSVRWITSMNTNIDKNHAFILLEFTLNDFAEQNIDYSLYSLNINVANFDAYLNKYLSTSSFLFNSTNQDHSFSINSFSIIENGYIDFDGVECSGDTCHSGVAIYGDKDKISYEDISIIQDGEDCALTDISCHLRNIKTKINNLIIRIGNIVENFISGLQFLFVPSDESLENFISTSKSDLESQVGFLSYPFELFISFLNRFFTLQPSSTISYNGFEFMNHRIIPSFTFDFNSLLEDERIDTFYNYYFIFINGLLCIAFVNLCLNKFKFFFGGDSK